MNCPRHQLEAKVLLPWGCQLYKNRKMFDPASRAFNLFSICFPSAGMEDFAQSLMSPWVNSTHFETNLTEWQQWICRKMALSVIMGNSDSNQGSMPHMQYNYRHYGAETFLKYPRKEVVAIRTEHEWEDITYLDRWLGGTGNEKNEEDEITHGSSSFAPSPLSQQSYQKLCCALVDEIEFYFLILEKASNLNPGQKEESRHEVSHS